MKVQEWEFQTLVNLGLCSSEARVYITLHEIGTDKATTISQVSGVSRPDVYRALSKLHQLGFVEKIIAKPFRFKAIPIETAVTILLERKTKQLNELKVQSTSLIHTLNKKNNHKCFFQESQFVLVPSKELLIKRLKKTIEKTEMNIDVSTSWKRFKFACYQLADDLEKAWSRGVKGRVIIEKPEESILDFLKTYWKSPYAKIKYTRSIPKTVMAIYDKKEVFIYVEPTADLTESPALWSNNPSVVTMAGDSFETLWNTALEEPAHHVNGEQT